MHSVLNAWNHNPYGNVQWSCLAPAQLSKKTTARQSWNLLHLLSAHGAVFRCPMEIWVQIWDAKWGTGLTAANVSPCELARIGCAKHSAAITDTKSWPPNAYRITGGIVGSWGPQKTNWSDWGDWKPDAFSIPALLLHIYYILLQPNTYYSWCILPKNTCSSGPTRKFRGKRASKTWRPLNETCSRPQLITQTLRNTSF